MKVLVIGATGQLGSELIRAPWPAGIDVTGLGPDEIDIAEAASVDRSVSQHAPGLLLNAAAYTAVDRAESEADAAFRTNRDGSRSLARACAQHGIPLLHVSTDYVFDGNKMAPYTEDDPVAPLGVYGMSKAEGEAAIREALDAHLIVRTSWLFGALGPNFVKTIMRLTGERDELRVVADQHGRPTHARDLAHALITMVGRYAERLSAPWGTYHFAGAGATTWHEVARLVVEHQARRTGRQPRVVPISTSEYPTPARRPRNSVLATTKVEAAFGVKPLPWQEGVREVVDALLG
jgi:dTDP-4-dehydrorhamnose reductase